VFTQTSKGREEVEQEGQEKETKSYISEKIKHRVPGVIGSCSSRKRGHKNETGRVQDHRRIGGTGPTRCKKKSNLGYSLGVKDRREKRKKGLTEPPWSYEVIQDSTSSVTKQGTTKERPERKNRIFPSSPQGPQ